MSPTQSPRERALAAANPFLSPGIVAQAFPQASADGGLLDLDARQDDATSIPLFRLDGHTYSIPADPPAGFALKYLAAVKEGAPSDAAAGQLLEDLLGEEAYAAMATSPKVKISDFAEVMKIVQSRVLGPVLDSLGK